MQTITITLMALTLSLMSFSPKTEPIVKKVTSRTSVTTNTPASIKWKSETVDVGEIPQGIPKPIEFEFKNVSKEAIVVLSAQGSCGCTSTDFPKTPVLPGTSTKITATFNAANKGNFTKTVTVKIANEEASVVLTFKGVVI
ncbi:MAG: DUF1573 domain-containing protein [Bacteroidota bacterium]